MARLVFIVRWLILAALFIPATATAAPAHLVKSLKVTVLSTPLADVGFLGEWGYSALVEADGHKFLYDTGHRPDLVLANARALGIDLSNVEVVILSHNHPDHTGGLLDLRRELGSKNPLAMSTAYVAAGIFEPRVTPDGKVIDRMAALRSDYEKLGGKFIVTDKPIEIAPGVWLTGPVPRITKESKWQPGVRRQTSSGLLADDIPEDSALVITTAQGLVVITGCGHAGAVNIADYASRITGERHIDALIGGLHLDQKSDDVVRWTAAQLSRFHPKYLLLGHCTGIEATFALRRLLGLTRRTAVVSAVGSGFDLDRGIIPGEIAA